VQVDSTLQAPAQPRPDRPDAARFSQPRNFQAVSIRLHHASRASSTADKALKAATAEQLDVVAPHVAFLITSSRQWHYSDELQLQQVHPAPRAGPREGF
jgi:hypothetical protein